LGNFDVNRDTTYDTLYLLIPGLNPFVNTPGLESDDPLGFYPCLPELKHCNHDHSSSLG